MRFTETGPPGGPAVLLIHGGGVGGWMWRPTLARLDPSFRVIVPELPGHDLESAGSYLGHADTLHGLIELIEARAPGGLHVAGFSLGAQLAILLAAARPDLVRSIIVVSAQTRPMALPGATLAMLSLATPLARQPWFARLQARELFVPDELLDEYVELSAHISPETLRSAVGENIRFTLPSGWAKFPGPALVLVGGRERRLMRDSAQASAAALPGAVLEVVPECGHGIPLQRPEWFANRLTRWMRGDAAGAGEIGGPNVGGRV
ncbi:MULTISPECIES: alpha/beta fold hydrolase [unclassified Leucobacter]|uniref:alpha/beta fold hydrolase n=1 Tax=unclassified Leucobacter TaxID=2621730 RepID=UPI00165DE9DC|nr:MULTISPECIES: alpha/beta hydrolase [unclassified Leucobacter]MBC9935855.1 alpha/beta hydrolase [Leucobacter sp. cx-87]